jgi:hypothetical protein
MLVACPECERRVSDRAVACPDCGFPVSEHFAAARKAADAADARKSRREIGAVDCVRCEARGFRMFTEMVDGKETQLFAWCTVCAHTGRAVLCEASNGFFAVARSEVARFLAGEAEPDGEDIQHLGTERPTGFRYPDPPGSTEPPSED